MGKEPCIICRRPTEFEAEYCCSGSMCGCRGMPIEPCVCSGRCYKAVMEHIGHPLDVRRKMAGIPLYTPNQEQDMSTYNTQVVIAFSVDHHTPEPGDIALTVLVHALDKRRNELMDLPIEEAMEAFEFHDTIDNTPALPPSGVNPDRVVIHEPKVQADAVVAKLRDTLAAFQTGRRRAQGHDDTVYILKQILEVGDTGYPVPVAPTPEPTHTTILSLDISIPHVGDKMTLEGVADKLAEVLEDIQRTETLDALGTYQTDYTEPLDESETT